MAINITALQETVNTWPEILGKLTFRQSILGLFVPHTGALPNQTYRWRFIDAQTVLGDCCADSDSPATFTEKETQVTCIADRSIYCELDLAAVADSMRFTAGMENAGSLEQLITDQHLASLSKAIDDLVWNGDTDLTGNRSKIDGLLKQADNDASSIKLNFTTGNIYQALRAIALAVPAEAYDYGTIGIFVGREVFNAFSFALLDQQNRYVQPAGNIDLQTGNGVQRLNIPGVAGIQLIHARGLDGTNRYLATPINNIHWVTNLMEDHVTLKWFYDEWHERYKWYVKFILGVTFGFGEYVVTGTIDSAVTTAPITFGVTVLNDPLNVGITSPLGTGGGVLTETTP